MDLETENRIAAILMKEAAELRRQAEKDGVDAYLRPPNVRGQPNSRFLTATVLGVQQANRVVEVNEMWRIRQKEKELDDRTKKDEKRGGSHRLSDSKRNINKVEVFESEGSLCTSSKRANEDEGLRDNEIEKFLHSRVKRGRGAVGSRMDETGPYLPDSKEKCLGNLDVGYRDGWDNRVALGPEKPLHLKSSSSYGEESSAEEETKAKRVHSTKHRRQKHRSEERHKVKKKKNRKEKKSSRSHKTML